MLRLTFLASVSILASCAPSSVVPLAADRLHDWSCPRAGTVLAWETNRGEQGVDRFEGAGAADPEICVWRTGGSTTRSWFLVRSVNTAWLPEERESFKNAARNLLDGRAQVVGFTDRRDNQQVSHIWRIVGEEDLQVGDRTIRAVRISGNNIFASNGRSWTFTRWYDPDRHLWLKTLDGSNGEQWSAVSISDP